MGNNALSNDALIRVKNRLVQVSTRYNAKLPVPQPINYIRKKTAIQQKIM